MGIFFFYNNRKPRKYNYVPITYNPEKEERAERLQKRIREIKRELNVPVEDEPIEKTDFKSEFVSQTKHLKKRKDREARGDTAFFTSNKVLVVALIVMLGLLIFWFLK